MKIKKAGFVKSSTNLEQCPEDGLTEVAFVGRSNVGKSSLINMLVQQNTLAKSSNKPGKTQLINHFLVNSELHEKDDNGDPIMQEWYLVDLPGYGYAKSGFENRRNWLDMMQDYLHGRDYLKMIFVLIDGKLPPQKVDLDFLTTLEEEDLPYIIIITKTDKTTQKKLHQNLNLLNAELQTLCKNLPLIITSSSIKGNGRAEILNFIETLILSE